MIKVIRRGSFKRTEKLLNQAVRLDKHDILVKYAKIGVEELSKATPSDSGKTSKSWGYTIEHGKDYDAIHWTNDHVAPGMSVPVALILQYGHATRGGGWVEGIDYINPALKPVFDDICNEVWKEVIG